MHFNLYTFRFLTKRNVYCTSTDLGRNFETGIAFFAVFEVNETQFCLEGNHEL